MIVMLPSIEDIALSTLGRLGDVDLEDILTLLSSILEVEVLP